MTTVVTEILSWVVFAVILMSGSACVLFASGWLMHMCARHAWLRMAAIHDVWVLREAAKMVAARLWYPRDDVQ